MNIYAIKDVMLEYFLTPFAAPGDKEVIAAISTVINAGGIHDAIAQAPHHYEIWQLGTVDQDGHIHAHKSLVQGCGSLVRSNVRRPEGQDRAPQAPQSQRTRPPDGDRGNPATPGALPETSPPATSGTP